ncbi:hypothetical protein [Xanthobacter versatilis]|uniref:DUF155 domain-containing protein n=1 Tax=Xanthobacter autotrophicus (strain ATCC BAA-1158 / Py2) TaxID=78245 RepID=A7IFJ9_XANP2|nr:hypothetical protein Xaut_1544 [Xanthobacter autotrophicus Py2]
MQRTLPNPSVEIEARAWRLRFLDAPPSQVAGLGEADVFTVEEPRKVFVVAEPVDATAPPSRFDDTSGRSLALLWMPPLAFDGCDNAWLEGVPLEGPKDGGRVVRAGLRTARVVWTNARAIIYASPDQFEDARDALIRFTILERNVCDIERHMPEVWASINRNVKLTHTIHPGDLRRNGTKVGRMTELVTEMNSQALHNDSALEQLNPTLSPGSKRLFAELALQADLYDRLEALAEPLDFAFEYHEVLNTRIIEASQWSKSNWIEIWILAVLVLELAATVYPLVEQFVPHN